MQNTIKRVVLSFPVRIAAGLLAAYLLLGYFAVDPLARRLLPWVAEHQLASRASVERVEFDPLRLILNVDQLRLTRADGAPLAGLDHLYLDLEIDGLLRWAWHLKDIHLAAPQVTLDVSPEGKLNWAELIARLNEDRDEDESESIPRAVIDHVQIERGDIRYSERNRAVPFTTALQPLGLELAGLSTLPEDRGDYQIVARLPEQGGTLKWKGEIGLNPIVSNGSIGLQGIKLAKLMQILPPNALPVRIAGGELQTEFAYRFALVKVKEDSRPEATLTNIALSLDGIQARLPDASGNTLGLRQLAVKLPELAFSMRQGLQLNFQGMQLGLKDVALQSGNTSLFTLPQAQASGVDFDLAARRLKVAAVALTDGTLKATRRADGSLDWQQVLVAAGGTGPASPPPADESADGQPFAVDIAGVHLDHWQAGYQDLSFKHPLSLDVHDINIGFALNNAGGAIAVTAIASQAGPLALKSRSSPQALATLARLDVHGGEIRLQDSTVRIPAIALSGLQTRVLLAADHSLNWQTALEPARPAAAAAPAAGKNAAAGDWKLALDSIALTNGVLHFEDRSAGSPVSLDIQNAALELRNASLDMARPVPVKASFVVKQGGRFDADGKLVPAPLKGDFRMKLNALAFKPFAPYLNKFALLRLNDGSASLAGMFAFKAGQVFNGQFRGGFSVDNLAISEENGGAAFLGWKTLRSDSVKLGLGPNQLHMDELRIVQPLGKIIIYEDKSINIQRILRPQNALAQPAAVKPAAGSDFPVAVERVKIENGELEFADLSLTPQFGTHINALSGVINGLSSNTDTTAQVELDGKVDEFGSARIRGAIQPFHATDYTDLKLAFHNLEMNRLTPYSGKFAGRRIDSGRLSVDLEYKIKQRQLAGENKFVINKLKLGERVDSRDAMSLPLDLAIAILEDSDGVIDLDLPISGNLDDPQFSYGKIIWKAITNVLTKVVTAPFRALGKLLGVNSEKLQDVGFDAGSAELAPEQQEKLKMLAGAMDKRPSLAVTVIPAYDPVADKTALQDLATRRDVLKETGVQLQADEKPGPLDLNNVKVQSAVERLLKARSGGGRSSKTVDAVKDYFRKSKPEDIPKYTEMLAQLRLTVPVADTELIALAKARAGAMQDYLVKAGLAAQRLSVADAVKAGGDGKNVNLKLELGVKPAAPAP